MSKAPQFIQITPPTGGKNISIPPQEIDSKSSPDLMNVRFSYGQLQTRAGFKGKYFGCGTHSVATNPIYTSDGLSPIITAFCLDRLYRQIPATNIMTPIPTAIEISASADVFPSTIINNVTGLPSGYTLSSIIIGSHIWDNAGNIPAGTTVIGINSTLGEITISQAASGAVSTTIHMAAHKDFTTGDYSNYLLDTGEGVYSSRIMNGGGVFPVSGYGAILAFTNAIDGVFIAFLGDSSPHSGIVICEKLYDAGSIGISGANCVAFFDNRLVIGGTLNSSSELLWSASSAFHDFTSVGAGSILIGEGIDWIQAMRKMGEFLIVYKERSIYIGQRSGRVEPAIVFSPAPGQGIGIAAPDTVGDLGEEHIFLGWDNVYTFSANGITAIGNSIKDELFGLYGDNGIVPTYLKHCMGAVVEEFSEYWLMVPTGKIPAVTNLMSRPNMDFLKLINADITNLSTTVTNVDQGDINYVKIGDSIKHAEIPIGAIIIGLPHMSSTIAANSIEMDKAATNTLSNISPTVGNDDTWAVTSDGNGDFYTLLGGNIGGVYQQLLFTTGTFVTLFSALIDLQEAGNEVVSLLVWLRGDVSATITCLEFTAGGVSLGISHELTVSLSGSEFSPIAFSFTCTDITCKKIRILIKNNTINVGLDIDGVQLCNITVTPQEFLYNLDGYYIPGIKGAYGEIQPIPFFIGSIGSWILDTVWVYNYQLKSWSCWRIPISGFGYDSVLDSFTIADLTGTVEEQLWRFDDKLLEALSPTNLISSIDGQIYEVSTAYQQDYESFYNYAILAYWQSKDIDLGSPEIDKTISRLIIKHEVSHPATSVVVSISINSGVTWVDQTIVIRQGYTETYADFFITGSQIRFRIQTAGVLKISGFVVKLLIRGESNAY